MFFGRSFFVLLAKIKTKNIKNVRFRFSILSTDGHINEICFFVYFYLYLEKSIIFANVRRLIIKILLAPPPSFLLSPKRKKGGGLLKI